MNYQEAEELHDLLFTFFGIFHEKFLSRYRRYYECLPMLKKNHVKIISVLYQHKHLIPTEIGRLLDIERGSLTALIDQLEEMGLVKRCNDPMDRRKSLISLTPAGRCEMNKIMDNYIQNLSLFFQDVDPGELKQFTESLRFAVEFMKKLQVG
ncbi:MAG TPA: MarR family winged helix-turn-helix transcriptional regulator [Bacillota bacterium]|nr:MarR family winged helix-turn-helix transcriptional regulator [Peptococcaceae bacterium MAG4]HPZ42633.1 MarR family winged helix-turn-helix transcriptional regulator [Bacillota bacterium]HQD75636.1 MarR family winged helix-turn-helix transcriptional regulator [Bacillota bacterium]HUM57993.1 MarR family winged helix-turn-helix transcriptional regulator [Bacillota bacterium]